MDMDLIGMCDGILGGGNGKMERSASKKGGKKKPKKGEKLHVSILIKPKAKKAPKAKKNETAPGN